MKIKIQDRPLTLTEIAHMAGGTLFMSESRESTLIRYICTDSREADAETLFCAIIGERVDGHNYISAAMGKGCFAVLCQKIPAEDICAVVVEDTVSAFGRLAEFCRQNHLKDLFITAVTGSVGKTTTKECIAAVLGNQENLFKKEGNYNSTIGLPLSMLEISRDHTAAVLEMGMSGFGEIQSMSNAAHPNVACIINIGTSHMEHLGSREGIAKAKLEIIEGMKSGSILLINGDEPLLDQAFALCQEKGITCLSVSITQPSADFYATNISATGRGMTFDLHTPMGIMEDLTILAVGEHMVWAAAFAASVGGLRGMNKASICQGLLGYRPAGMRQNMTTQNGITFIEDCYNAAPESMTAALSVLKLTAKGRMIAVLGDMKELGDDTVNLHRAVGQKVAELASDGREICLVTVGDLGAKIAASAASSLPADCIFVSRNTAPYEDVVRHLKDLIREGDTVLFKASRAMTLEVIFNALKAK
ncbi:MAG: UDP-N-acetylmuramoyl-tripeptide--D-alanyl-D-alanine ligase [Ruminococcaceae bacterium]|nr:UDP-N-acetylmuramoyl-tripeptide--D-alanyl-D-alanine ligase [Oscillospiraceae bacterium]